MEVNAGNFSWADSEGGGGGQGVQTPTPPGKSQVIWVSVVNNQLGPPLKKLYPSPLLENVEPPLEP